MAKSLSVLILATLLCRPLLADTDAHAESSACIDDDATIHYWREIRKTADSADADSLALALADCLASPNPELRDRIGYEVLAYWLRNGRLSARVSQTLYNRLLLRLTAQSDLATQAQTPARAFSALILSELVRQDIRVRQWDEEQTFRLLQVALGMFERERDYRGRDPRLGWLHAIAHGADLLWQLALHPLIDEQHRHQVLESLSTQLVRPDIPAYVFNEGSRLARVVVAIATRDTSDATLLRWLEQITGPNELGQWQNAFNSRQGMFRLHNLKQFLHALELQCKDQCSEPLRLKIATTLSTLP